ncbi:MAG: ATP-binding cassette domain-containing protein [Acidimicrobiales bacterium]
MTVVVQAESLTKRLGEVSAVTDHSFALEAGTIKGLLGPTGAGGTTTTLRIILGLVAPSHGRAVSIIRTRSRLVRYCGSVPCWRRQTSITAERGRDHLRMLGQAADLPDSRADEVLRLAEFDDAAHRRVTG